MIVADLVDKLDRADVLRLFTAAFGSRETAQRARRRFRAGDWGALCYERDGAIVAFIGFEPLSGSAVRIRGIAVDPRHRGMGIGRLLIRELRVRTRRMTLLAETDRDAVGFYRHYGFEVRSLGEKFPGVERFECVLRGDAAG